MAKKKPKLTPNQLEYQKQLKLLKKRIKSWERKGYLYDYSLPETPKRINKKDIQKLKNIQFRKFTKEQKQQLRRNYEHREELKRQEEYEDGWGWYEPDYSTYWPESNEPVNTEREISRWLDDIIDEIINPDLIERERAGAKDLLKAIIDNARRELGEKGFYTYLQDPKVVTDLKNAASRYIQSYRKKNGYDNGDASLREFTETLNLGRPLTQEQAEDLEIYGTVGFDYSGTDYD